MKNKLIDYLRESAGRPFALGRNDCCLFIADWWRAVHGVDPVAEWRGTYRTEEDKRALLDREGGMVALISRIADRAGTVETENPITGDFGLIKHGDTTVGAICTGTAGEVLCWAVRSETGVAFTSNPKVLKAWALNA